MWWPNMKGTAKIPVILCHGHYYRPLTIISSILHISMETIPYRHILPFPEKARAILERREAEVEWKFSSMLMVIDKLMSDGVVLNGGKHDDCWPEHNRLAMVIAHTNILLREKHYEYTVKKPPSWPHRRCDFKHVDDNLRTSRCAARIWVRESEWNMSWFVAWVFWK